MHQSDGITVSGTFFTRRIHYLVVLSFFWILATILGLYIVLDTEWVQPSHVYILSFLLIIIFGTWAARLLKLFYREYSLVFHAPLIISILVIISWGLPILAGFLVPGFWEEHHLSKIRAEPILLVRGWIMVLLGLFFMWLGNAVGLRSAKGIRNSHVVEDSWPSLTIIIQLYIFITTLRLIRIIVTGVAFGAQRANWGPLIVLDQTLGYLEVARFLLLAIVTRQVYQGHWPRLILTMFIATEIIFGFTSGFMKPILQIAMVVLASMLSVGKYPDRAKLSAAIAVFVVLSILVVPIAQELRASHLRVIDTRSPSTVWSATIQAYESSWGKGFDYGWDSFTEKTVGRQAGVVLSPGLILQKTPGEIPYLGIKEFLTIPLYLVPRFLWLDKPVLSKGVWFSIVYLGMPSSTGSSSAMTIFGEAYLYNGWTTLIAGMLVLGFSLAKIFNFTALSGRPEIYLALLPGFLGFESQYSTLVIGLLQKWLVLYLIYFWLRLASTKNRISIEKTV